MPCKLCLFHELTYSCSAHLSVPMSTVLLILLFTINIPAVTSVVFILLLLSLFYCGRQITVTTYKLLREKSFSGVFELTTQLLRLINILWLPLCRINKLGYTTREDCCDPLHLWVITRQRTLVLLIVLLVGSDDQCMLSLCCFSTL